MNFLGHDWTFWVALLGAALVRVLTPPFHSLRRAAAQVFISVFLAWLLTDSVVDYLHLNPEIYKAPIGGLIALTADGIVRLALNWAANPTSPLGLVARLRGGGAPPEDGGEGGK